MTFDKFTLWAKNIHRGQRYWKANNSVYSSSKRVVHSYCEGLGLFSQRTYAYVEVVTESQIRRLDFRVFNFKFVKNITNQLLSMIKNYVLVLLSLFFSRDPTVTPLNDFRLKMISVGISGCELKVIISGCYVVLGVLGLILSRPPTPSSLPIVFFFVLSCHVLIVKRGVRMSIV